MTARIVATISELRAVLATTPAETLVTLPSRIVRELIDAADAGARREHDAALAKRAADRAERAMDGLAGRGA